MADITIKLFRNKTLNMEGDKFYIENGGAFHIVAGEENATTFAIVKPDDLADYNFYVEMINSQGYGIGPTMIENDQFTLPIGMAVAGYGLMSFSAIKDDVKIVWLPTKVKVWNTLPDWKQHISNDKYVTKAELDEILGDIGEAEPKGVTIYTDTGTLSAEELQILKDGYRNYLQKGVNRYNFNNEEDNTRVYRSIYTGNDADTNVDVWGNLDSVKVDMSTGTYECFTFALNKVVPNKILEGNEEKLTSLEVGGKTYKVGEDKEYTLPQATETALGGVKVVSKTAEMTEPIGIDDDGKLWGKSGGGELADGSVNLNKLSTDVKAKLLPNVTTADSGKVATVDENGKWVAGDLPSGGTTVIANPTLSGSEAELTGLEVDDKKYKVPSGGGIVAVDSLPTPSQTEYEKHLLYLKGGELNFIAEKVAEEPTVDVVASLPSARSDTSACAIGTNAYVFGGYSSSNLSNIVKFDSVSQTVTKLSVSLPSARRVTSACAIGTNAYVFGGLSNSYLSDIVKFDSVSQTVTRLSKWLPSDRVSTSACAIGANAYIFGGSDGDALLSDIVKFDSVSQTVTKLSVSLPSGRSKTSACAIDTNAYIFGGSGTGNSFDIVKFDSISQTVTKLSVTLPSSMSSTSACAIGTNAYIFGGSGYISDIVKFDSVSQTATKLSVTLPSARSNTSACAIGTDAYVFGGDSSSGRLSDIVQVAFGTTYVYKQITSTEV